MSCTFSLPVNRPLEELVEKAKSTVESQGGTFSGDISTGNFHLSAFGNTVGGSYTVNNDQMDIVINEKPFMLPCAMIESFLKSQLS